MVLFFLFNFIWLYRVLKTNNFILKYKYIMIHIAWEPDTVKNSALSFHTLDEY
jgi:hypothetical protein